MLKAQVTIEYVWAAVALKKSNIVSSSFQLNNK